MRARSEGVTPISLWPVLEAHHVYDDRQLRTCSHTNSAGQLFYPVRYPRALKQRANKGFDRGQRTNPNQVKKHPNSTAFSLGIIRYLYEIEERISRVRRFSRSASRNFLFWSDIYRASTSDYSEVASGSSSAQGILLGVKDISRAWKFYSAPS